jgi:hypothetical protein
MSGVALTLTESGLDRRGSASAVFLRLGERGSVHGIDTTPTHRPVER